MIMFIFIFSFGKTEENKEKIVFFFFLRTSRTFVLDMQIFPNYQVIKEVFALSKIENVRFQI